MRAGLPVHERERTVSLLVAWKYASSCAGDASASSTREPDRAGPHALRAHRERRRDLAAAADAARGEHRRRRHRVDHLGPQHHRADLAGVAAALGALRDDDVDARRLVLQRLVGAAAQRGDQAAASAWIWSITSFGGVPSAFAISFTFSCRSETSTCGVAVASRPAEQLLAARLVRGQLGHAVVGEDLRANSRCC